MTVAGRCKVSLLLHFLGSEGIKLYNTSEFAAAVPAEEGVQEVIPAENRDDLDTVVWKFDAHYRHKKYRSIKRHSGISRLQARRRWATWILLLTWSTRQKSVRPPRPVPAPIRNQVKKELDHLEESGIITKVTKPAPWQIPTRAYTKQTTTTSRCLHPHHLNKAIQREHYPLNSIDDITTRLKGSKYFSVRDANMGFYQIPLSEKSSYYTTFNTQFCRYQHRRYPMGISSAPEIFQWVITEIFTGIDGVEIQMDDLLVHRRTLKRSQQIPWTSTPQSQAA